MAQENAKSTKRFIGVTVEHLDFADFLVLPHIRVTLQEGVKVGYAFYVGMIIRILF